LFDGVDDLIRRVADTENPEIRRVRAKVHAALVAAKNEFAANGPIFAANGPIEDMANQPKPAPRPAVQVSADDPLRDYPGSALGVALLVGIGLGLVVSLRQ
jgi:ElaB/YqjD/DUF883 family membrane-anchored ribosome-binding protein